MKANDIDRILYYLKKVFVGPSEADDLFRVIEVLKNERHKRDHKQEHKHGKK